MIYKWHFEIPLEDVRNDKQYRLNERLYGGESETSCFLCCKQTKPPHKYVRYLENGNLVSHQRDLPDCQGYFHIGNECAKKLPSNFIFSSID